MPTFEKSLPPKQTILLFSISLLSLTLIVSYAVGNLAQLNQIYDRFADISWTTWSKAIIDRWPIKTLDEVTNIAPAVTNLSFVLVSDSNVTILTGEVPVQHRCVLKLDTTLETQLVLPVGSLAVSIKPPVDEPWLLTCYDAEYVVELRGPIRLAACAWAPAPGLPLMMNAAINAPGAYELIIRSGIPKDSAGLVNINRNPFNETGDGPLLQQAGEAVFSMSFEALLANASGGTPTASLLNTGHCALRSDYWAPIWSPAAHPAYISAATAIGLPWLWYQDGRDVPLLLGPADFHRIVGHGTRMAFIGDSLVRTTFQAFVDMATNYTFPYKSIGSHWCRQTSLKPFPDGVEFRFHGDGCWSGNATIDLALDGWNATLHYLVNHLTSHPQPLSSRTHNYDWIILNFGLHDIGQFSPQEFQENLSARIKEVKVIHGSDGKPARVIYLGLWAQNIKNKPLMHKWSGSHTRARAFIEAMKTVCMEQDVPYLDTFDMSLSVSEACRDGVHYNESVTRVVSMRLLDQMMRMQ